MSMQAFIDESEASGKHFVFAGLIGRAERWADFSARWKTALSQQPKIDRFKFHEFDHRQGAFSNSQLPSLEREKKVAELVTTLSGAGFTRVSVTLGIPAFLQMADSALSGTELAIPYCYAFQLIVAAVASELLEQGQTERCEIVFDEHLMFGPKARKWYPLVRELCVTDRARSILPAEPIFRKDDDTMALQAADLYAGLVRSSGGEKHAARDAILSPLLVALSEIRANGSESVRAQAGLVRRCWDDIAVSLDRAQTFVPLAARLRKNIAALGGDPVAERTLSPVFTAVDAINFDNPDGLAWLRQELAEVTLLSKHSDVHFDRTKEASLDEAVQRYGIARGQLNQVRPRFVKTAGSKMTDISLARAIALLDEDSIESFRRRVTKRRANAAGKSRRKREG